MNEKKLIEYYNKFNEDKRLDTRHGQVEFNTTLKYVLEYLREKDNPKIIEIGAGTGKYSIFLSEAGYDVSAVELVKHNLRVIEKNGPKVKAYQGNAINLSKFDNEMFDMVLLFGPMYHLISKEEKIKALNEAKRILKSDGILMVAYCMNDFAIIKHGFMDGNILNSINQIDNKFKIVSKNDDLYSRVRLEDIDELNEIVGLNRIKIITPDGMTDYIRPSINKLSDEEFNLYLKYHYSVCERNDFLGLSAHTLDILKK